MVSIVAFTKSLTAASANNIATAQAAVAGTPLNLNGSAVTNGVATIDAYNSSTNTEPGRRVLITSASGAETASVTIFGTNSSNQNISETITFSGASTTVQSNLDYVTVTNVVPSGTIVGNLSAGTSGVGSSRWVTGNYFGSTPMSTSIVVEIVSVAVNYTGQYTPDDPNFLPSGVVSPLALNIAALTNVSATSDSAITTPVAATRVLINSGTGVIRVRIIEAGIG